MSFLSSLMNALPGAAAQGLAWGIMAIGVYITFRILDVADLTVDGSLATGGAVCVMLIRGGFNPWIALLCAMLAGMLAGLVTGLFHTRCGIPAILAGILTQLALYSINLRIMDSKANQALSVDKYPLLLSQRYVRELSMNNPLPLLLLFTAAVIAILYWFFGTEKGSSLRATGANPHMARAQGINTNSNIVLGLMVSNGLVALSGALLAQYQGSSDINMGRGAIVIGLAAVIIGEVIFGKIFTNFGLTLLAVSIGAIIYYIVLLLAFAIVLFIYRKKVKERANVTLMKRKGANKVANRRLKRAKRYMNKGQKELFYEEMLTALWGYYSDKLSIPVSELNRDNISKNLDGYGLSQEAIGRVINILDECEFSRYAQSAESNVPMAEIYRMACDSIDEVENTKKKQQ